MSDIDQIVGFLERSELFDDDWYQRVHPDVKASGLKPAEHYARVGFRIARDPRDAFGLRDYLSQGKSQQNLPLRQTLEMVAEFRARQKKGQRENVYANLSETQALLEMQNQPAERDLALHHLDFYIERGDHPRAIELWRDFLDRLNVDCSRCQTDYDTDLRIIVYTCLFGNYESVKEPERPDPRVRWLLFTDDDTLTSTHWEVIYVSETRSSLRRASRAPKMQPHRYLPDHDISIYVDSSLTLITPDIVGLAQVTLADKDIAMYLHHDRICVYDEIRLVRELGIESDEACAWFERYYQESNHPTDAGLWENTLIVRRDTDQSTRLNNAWWELYERVGGERDQLPFAAALNETKAEISAIEIGDQVRFNPFVHFTKHNRQPKPPQPRVFKFIAYAPSSYQQNLGRTYNDYMARLSDDDVAVFVDHDAMLASPSADELISSLAARCVAASEVVIARTNRIGAPYQRLSLLENDHDLLTHQAFSEVLSRRSRDRLYDATRLPSSSGVLIMASKRTWQQTRFIEGFLGVDNAFHKDVRANGGKLLLAEGLYLYHFYRADGDTSHALRLVGSNESSALPVSAGHVLRNFIFSHDEPLRVSDYLELLDAGDWAVFQSANSIHCLKDWYPRIESHLADSPEDSLLCLDSNLLHRDAPAGNDHLQHRAFAAQLPAGVRAPERPAASDIQAFVLSRSLMERLAEPGSRAQDLPALAERAETPLRVANDIYLQIMTDTVAPSRQRDEAFTDWLAARNRVAILTLGFWPTQAGMEMFIHNLAWRMTEDGDEVVLFTPKPDVEFEEIERNYIIRRYRSEDELISLIGKHHLSLPFDCLLVQGAHTGATLALKAKAAFDIPVILRTHGEDIQIDADIGYGYRLKPKLAAEIEHNIRNVDHHVVIGSHVEADVRGIDPDATVSVINNGVDINRFTTEKSSYLRDWLGIPAETRILLSVGRNHPKKCFHYAVEALAILRAEGLNVCLVHIGRQGKGIDLEQLALELGVADRFYHPGPVNYFDTPEVYASADIFLFPSKQETFGNVTVEAMSSGLPCVEFDYGANHDKIDPGHDGFIVPFGDLDAFVAHIRTLLEDDELRRQIGKAARASMENKFTWDTVTAKYREAIHALALKNDERATPSYGRSALNATQQINTTTRK